ncbi:MAG: alpha/beta fold hydrolase [Gammaproteobacteria bacterium]|nr:alpha/beta fold hydrolase [Gammaproteobacteria bacterium]
MGSASDKAGVGGETVILVHGLWMHGLVFFRMASLLRRQGYRVRRFSYRSMLRTPAENADLLAKRIDRVQTPVVHLVGHSLGGIVVLHLLDRQLHLKPGRVVLLGCPARGSEVAARLMRIPLLGAFMLGKSVHKGLLGGAPGFSGQRELGVVYGNRPIGAGRLFVTAESSGDGTVLARETNIDKARDSIELNETHTSMIFSAEVARQIGCFLDKGRFCKSARDR